MYRRWRFFSLYTTSAVSTHTHLQTSYHSTHSKQWLLMLTLSTKSNCDTAPAVHWHLSPALCFLLSTLTFYCCLLNWCPTVRSEEHTSHIIRYTGTTEEGRYQNSSCIEQVLVVSELTGPVMNEYLKQYVATLFLDSCPHTKQCWALRSVQGEEHDFHQARRI